MNKIRKQHSDYLFLLAIFALIAFGLIMIYSVSKYYSLQITDGDTDKYYLKKQLVSLGLGVLAISMFQAIDYRFWQKNASSMLMVTLGLLILPYLFSDHGAKRWVDLGFTTFQPSEVAKLTFVIYLSAWFASKRDDLREIGRMFWPFAAVVGFISVLLLVQKDLGTLSVFVALSTGIFVVAGSPLYQLFAGAGMAGFLLWLAVKLEPYRMERITAFLNPESSSLGSGYHIRNALIAIGSGGIWGLGFGQSRQKYLYLPEAHTDSIFAIIAEELGLVRSAVLIILFAIIAVRGYKIASRAPDTFSRLMVVGVITWVIAQAFVNIAAMLSLVPLTGIPMPFVSYGGSSLAILLAAIGIVVNISRSCKSQ